MKAWMLLYLSCGSSSIWQQITAKKIYFQQLRIKPAQCWRGTLDHCRTFDVNRSCVAAVALLDLGVCLLSFCLTSFPACRVTDLQANTELEGDWKQVAWIPWTKDDGSDLVDVSLHRLLSQSWWILIMRVKSLRCESCAHWKQWHFVQSFYLFKKISTCGSYLDEI